MTRFVRSFSRPSFPASPRLSPAFSRPAWWAALVVLVINDHLLKGAGWLPGWLTGKLSDFAFLLVAPAIAHSVLPVRLPGRRLVASLSIAIPFALAKAFPTCTHFLESVVRGVGITWKLWTDPTDLIALAILPVSWMLLARPLLRHPNPTARGDLLHRAAVALGALACVATSANWPRQVRPFVRNATSATEQVQVQWLLKDVACTTPLPQIARDLHNGDFSPPTSVQLEASAFAAVDMPPRTGSSPVGACSNDPSARQDVPVDGFCPVVLVQVGGVPAVLTRTSGFIEDDSVCSPSMWPEHRPAGEIRLETGPTGALRWVAGHDVQMIEFSTPPSWSEPPPAGSCQAIAAQYEQDLRGAQSCTVDQDCRPVAAGACDAISVTVSGAVDSDVASFAAAGCSLLSPICELKPAICATGQCAIDCPLVHLDSCPRTCAGTRTGDVCANQPCLNDQGDLCSCADGENAFTCAPPPAPPPGCRNWCL